MEFHLLRYGITVRFAPFTRAAEHERVARPSLSQRIRKLEDKLAARLFGRLRRRVGITPFGERFLQYAPRPLAEIDSAKQEVSELLRLRQRPVSARAILTVAPYVLPRALTAFRRAYSGVAKVVGEGLTTSSLAQLADAVLDLAVMGLPVKGAEFVSEPLLSEWMLLAAPTRHRLSRWRRPGSFQDSATEPLLLLKPSHCFRDDVLEICKRSRCARHVVLEGACSISWWPW